MTVATEIDRSGPYAGAGTTGPFPVQFRILDATHLQVIKRTSTGETTLVYATDYSVAGVGNPTCSVTLVAVLPVGETLTIIRDVPKTQEADYVQNDDFPAESHENALDKLTMITQQLGETLGRALTLPASSAGGVSTELPVPEANKFLAWNSVPDALENVDAATLATIVAFGTANADLFSGNGVTTAFNLTANPGALANLDVIVGGVGQRAGVDYTWSGGTVVTFTTAPPLGTNNVQVRYFQGLPTGITDAGSVTFNTQVYPAGTVGGALTTTVWGDGVSDRSAQLAAANALGYPIQIKGVLVIGTPTTVTVPIVDTMNQIFSTGSQVTINNGLPVRPEWFGSAAGNIRLAVNALPSTGGVVKLANKTYPPSYNTAFGTTSGVDYLAKPNIRLVGEKTPKANSGFTALEGGTIIHGPFMVFADGFEIDRAGVDSGSSVCATLYGGVAQEGFAIYKPGQSLVTPNCLNVTIGELVAICKSPTDTVHAILLEAIDNLQFTNLRAFCAFHGVVIKSRFVNGANVFSKGNTGEGLICKSDNYAVLGNVNIANVYVEAISGVTEAGFGVLVEAVTNVGYQVNLDNVQAYRKANGFCARSNGAGMSDVQVGNLITETCPIGALLSGNVVRVRIDSAVINNCTYGVQVDAAATSISNAIGKLVVTNATDGINASGKLSVADATFETISGYAINHATTAARVLIDQHREFAVSNFWQLQPALAGSWVNEGGAGNAVFRVTALAGKVVIGGLIKSGAAATITTLSTQIRPPENLRLVAQGYNGAAYSLVQVIIDTAGVVTIPNFAAGSTYISLDGVEFPIPT